MRIKEMTNEVEHYLSVESHYNNPEEAKGQQDAILFEMGNSKGDIDAVVAVPVSDARDFALAILKISDEIETDKNGVLSTDYPQAADTLYGMLTESKETVVKLVNQELKALIGEKGTAPKQVRLKTVQSLCFILKSLQ